MENKTINGDIKIDFRFEDLICVYLIGLLDQKNKKLDTFAVFTLFVDDHHYKMVVR